MKISKLFRKLGDTPWEFIANLLLIILIGPILIVLYVLAAAWGLIGKVLGFAAPKQVPGIAPDNMPSKELYQLYCKAFSKALPGLKISQKKEQTTLSKNKTLVTLSLADDAVYIEIEGLDTGSWHTVEAENIDLFFWAAVGALRNGITFKKSRTGRNEGWFYSDEMRVWMGVSTNGSKSFSSYHKFAKKI